METPTQRLATAVKEQSASEQHYNSPLEQIRRKNLKGSEAPFAEGRREYHTNNVMQVQKENAAIAKMHDISGRTSPIATAMSFGKGKK